jgi:hypothetical protein
LGSEKLQVIPAAVKSGKRVNQTNSETRLELEALEPRVLLSGEAMIAAPMSPTYQFGSAAAASAGEEIVSSFQMSGSDSVVASDPAGQLDRIFEGISSTPLAAEGTTGAGQPLEAGGPVQGGGSQSAVQAAVGGGNQSGADGEIPQVKTDSTRLGLEDRLISSVSARLTETLRAANGPPAELVGVVLPGLHLVDPTVSRSPGQVVYLDFSGAHDVTYRGPVTVNVVSIPAFSLAGPAHGQEEEAERGILALLAETFEGSGLAFEAQEPLSAPFSTVYIGGTGTEFQRYGPVTSVAENVDAGNADKEDAAFVFTESFLPQTAGVEEQETFVAGRIAHEVGHLVGFAHDQPDPSDSPLAEVAATYKLTWNIANSMTINPITKETHSFIVDGVVNAERFVRWYVNGVFQREDHSYWLNLYWDPTFDYSFSNATGTTVILGREYHSRPVIVW